MNRQDRIQIKRILVLQSFWTVLCSAIPTLWDPWIGRSAGIGAGIALVANGLFAYSLFRPYRACELPALARQVYGAAFLKVIISLILFGTAFAMIDQLSIPSLLLAYGIAQIGSPMLASFWTAKR